MTAADAESEATGVYREVGLDPDVPASPFRIVRLLLGPQAVDIVANMVGPPAQMYRINGQPRFAIKRSAPLEYQKFWLGHELGHYVFERAGYVGEDIESVCDAFGAAVMAPRPAVLRLHQQFGLDFRKIADAVRATQTWAALRIGEVLRRPLAAVSPGAVRVRGPEAWVWPDESTLRRWASGRSRPGLAKVRLTDQPRRVALLGDEDASETG